MKRARVSNKKSSIKQSSATHTHKVTFDLSVTAEINVTQPVVKQPRVSSSERRALSLIDRVEKLIDTVQKQTQELEQICASAMNLLTAVQDRGPSPLLFTNLESLPPLQLCADLGATYVDELDNLDAGIEDLYSPLRTSPGSLSPVEFKEENLVFMPKLSISEDVDRKLTVGLSI
jgi:hypothetical protein